jgi:hypothetical protein
MRRAGALLVVVAVAAAVASQVHAAPVPSCAQPEVRVHDEAVFGHFSTLATAKRLKARAAALGFNGIKIENEGCGDFEVEIDGADRQADRASFSAEARKAGFPITFEQIAPPMQYRAGEVVGIFARKETVAAANALMWKLAGFGFQYIDLVRQGSSWLVVMPQVPVKAALSIAHEVSAAGFQIQFQPGNK